MKPFCKNCRMHGKCAIWVNEGDFGTCGNFQKKLSFETKVIDDQIFVGLLENNEAIDSLEIEHPKKYNCTMEVAILEAFGLTASDVNYKSLQESVQNIFEFFIYK